MDMFMHIYVHTHRHIHILIISIFLHMHIQTDLECGFKVVDVIFHRTLGGLQVVLTVFAS